MKASLEQRIEYIKLQLMYARLASRTIEQFARNTQIADAIVVGMVRADKDGIAEINVRLDKAAAVLQGAEPPLGKRDKLDLDAPVDAVL